MYEPVVEYDLLKGGVEEGLHLYVFDNGLLVARITPSVAGPVIGDGEGRIVTACVDGSEVGRWVSAGLSLEQTGSQGPIEPGKYSAKCLTVRDGGEELSYATKGELPREVSEFVAEIMSEFGDIDRDEDEQAKVVAAGS